MSLEEGAPRTYPRALSGQREGVAADSHPEKAGARPSGSGVDTGVDVFISYARADRLAAAELFFALKARGVRPYWDEQSVLPGDNWFRDLPPQVAGARLTAAIVAAHSESSYWNFEEVISAVSDVGNRRVVPIYLPGRTPTNSASFGVRQKAALFYDDLGSWDAVAAELQRVLDESEARTSEHARAYRFIAADVTTLTDEIWHQLEPLAADWSPRPPVREARGLHGRLRHLQVELLGRAESRLADSVGGADDPLVVRIERSELSAPLADPRHLLRLEGAPGRIALTGEIGSGRHRVALQLLQTLADAAQAAERGIPHFADHLGDLLPAVVSIEDLRTGTDPVAERLPHELRARLDRHPETIERMWLILLLPHPAAGGPASDHLFDHLLENPIFAACPNLLLLAHYSARRWLARGWDLASLGGVHVERVSDPHRRRWLRRCSDRTRVDHLPVDLVRDLSATAEPDLDPLVVRLICHALRQQPREEVRPEIAAFLLDRTLPSVLGWIHRQGGSAVGAGDIVDLFRSRPAIFPDLSDAQESVALLIRLPFLFRVRDGEVAVLPSFLAARLTARGLREPPSKSGGTPSPFDLSVLSFWAQAHGEPRPAPVPSLVHLALAPEGDRTEEELRAAAAAVDPGLRQSLMLSYLAEPLADVLRPVITEPTVRELLGLMDPITRALWAYEELTGREVPEVQNVSALLGLIDPGHSQILLAMAPNRAQAFIDAASRSLDRALLKRHLGDLFRTYPHRLPATVVDRLSRPGLL